MARMATLTLDSSLHLGAALDTYDTVSESSYVTSVEEPCARTERTERGTQTQPRAPRSHAPHPTSRLQRHHTSDVIYDARRLAPPPRPLAAKSRHPERPRGLALSDSYPFIVDRTHYDSGYSTVAGSRRNGFGSTDSPTISITPPNSLEYVGGRGAGSAGGGGSPAGSLTPNGMTGKSSAPGLFLNPHYLHATFNQSGGSEVALTMPGECTCRCGGSGGGGAAEGEPPPPRLPTSEGLSWRRLHMSRAKLKATATTSELLSGFAMVAMVELQINEPTNVPEWLFVMFAVCTTVLVAVHIFALMISTYLLPNIDAVSKMETPLAHPGALRDSPHERMRGFIELAWAFSTVLGLFLFLVEIAILCWVKFWDYSFAAATAATVIVIPVLIVFVAFAIHFYHSLVVQKCKSSVEDMQQLESMKRDLDSATAPAPAYHHLV